jgi:aryl-alcohol dehydrogenase-like predicted oxidoreductase
MDYRQLGRSGLKVSALAMGTNTFGRAARGAVNHVRGKEAELQIRQCIDAGVNLFDTADVYAGGASEKILGEALDRKRPDVLIASKVRFPAGSGPNDAGTSRHHIIAACEGSLRRLGTDWIDIYQAHEWDGVTPLDEMLEALDRLVRDGKVRYIGCSNFPAWQLVKALWVADVGGRQPFVSQQIHYSLESRDAEFELVPLSLDLGLGIFVWSPLAGGLLSGKFRRGDSGPKGSRHFARKHFEPPIYDEGRLYAIIDALVEIAGAHGCSAARIALAWLLHQPGVTSVIVGARTKEQLADNLAAADLKLSPGELAKLDAVSRPNLPYPHWHQAMWATDRLGAADLSLIAKYL